MLDLANKRIFSSNPIQEEDANVNFQSMWQMVREFS